jgi:hypothetical protein
MIQKWSDIDFKISEFANEAKSNVKFQTLRKYFPNVQWKNLSLISSLIQDQFEHLVVEF